MLGLGHLGRPLGWPDVQEARPLLVRLIARLGRKYGKKWPKRLVLPFLISAISVQDNVWYIIQF